MKAYNDELKAQALAMCSTGQSINQTARDLGIDPATVCRWKQAGPAPTSAEIREKYDALLFQYLEDTLETLSIQSRFFRREEWLEKQNAAEIAILHGVQADKAIRLFGAITTVDN